MLAYPADMRKKEPKVRETRSLKLFARRLVDKARESLPRAYAPFSGFKVACAILTFDGHTFVGVNVENDSYGLSICAERVALCAMIAKLGGNSKIRALAVIAEHENPIYPCGACRQMLLPFVDGGTVLYVQSKDGEIEAIPFLQLFPHPFSLKRAT